MEPRLAWEEFGPIPGQRIGLDVATGEGYLFDPLHEARHSALRQKIEDAGFCLPPERESFPGIDATTWAFWMRRAVEAGLAKITQGSLPENLPGKPRMRFVGQEEKDERDTRLERLERQNERLMALLLATLPADKRRTVERELAQGE